MAKPTQSSITPIAEILSNHQIFHVPLANLKPYGRQARVHSKDQIKKLMNSVSQFGFLIPILVDENNRVLSGWARVLAMKGLRRDRVPAIQVSHLSHAEKRAFILADNRISELAEWDQDILAIEFNELLEQDLNFEIEVSGFDLPEINLIVGDAAIGFNFEADNQLPDMPNQPTFLREGDLVYLGTHKILCGNALDPSAYRTLMPDEIAHMVFTDPPYNVPIQGHVSGKGRVQHREFPMASGEMTDREFLNFLSEFLAECANVCADGSVIDICMDWRHIDQLLAAGKAADLELINLCVWNKDNGGMGSLYRSKHELVAIFRKGQRTRTNNVQLGRYGRNRTNVWDYPGVNSLRKDRMKDLSLHPTVKPVDLVADAILDVTNRGEIILDPFCGSGTSLIAAQRTARRCFAIELDPGYVQLAARRFESLFDVSAIHVETGLSLDELARRRLPSPKPKGRSQVRDRHRDRKTIASSHSPIDQNPLVDGV